MLCMQHARSTEMQILVRGFAPHDPMGFGLVIRIPQAYCMQRIITAVELSTIMTPDLKPDLR